MINVGQRFGDFEILERLGENGIGMVFKARQTSRDRIVVLKTLHATVASDPEYLARFYRDAKIATELSHPDIVRVYGAEATDGVHWLATEFVEGTTAEARLKRKGRLALPEALAIATHIATVLDYGWRKAQLIHRDVEPDTILLSKKSEVKLRGLGLAKSAGEMQSLALSGAPMGAPHYMSPEQAEGKKDVDLRADIYSLGCTLFHFISGETPYKGDTAMAVILKHVTTPVPELHRVFPACPAEVSRVVMKMMHKHPAGRYQSYDEVIADLRLCYETTTSAPAAPPVPVSAPEPEPIAVKAALMQEIPVAKPAPPPPENTKHQQPAPDVDDTGDETPAVENRRSLKKPLAIVSAALLAGVAAIFSFTHFGKGDRLTEAERAAKERLGGSASGQPDTDQDAPGESALPTATKDTPFVNSLGMKFVVVPITGGPTGGKRVLFSVWETRVEDYGRFAKDTKRERKMPPFPQQAIHPVVNVSWEDAQAFCTWLTDREHKSGKLDRSARYRLPSDHEWSCAVGIGEREDAAKSPAQKSTRIANAYPWGSSWPPLAGLENYCGDEVVGRELLGDKSQKPLPGYRDEFPFTSAVGSLGANRMGLFDLGGNVWEWCEDSFDGEEQERDIRGASFASTGSGTARLLSSSRTSEPPAFRAPDGGFRVVLAIAPPPPIRAKTAPATVATASPAPAPAAPIPTPTPAPAPVAPLPLTVTPAPIAVTPQSATKKWLAEQDQQWQATFATEVTGPFEKGLADLKARYLAAIDAQLVKTTDAMKFEAEALRSERTRAAEGREIPAEDESIAPPVIKTLRDDYRATFARLDAERSTRAKSVHEKYDKVLAQMQASLNLRRLLGETAEVQARREALRAEWLKPPAGATAAVATAPPPTTKPAQGQQPPPSKGPKLKPREVVERLLGFEALVSIDSGGAPKQVTKMEDLPGDRFIITKVELNARDGMTEADLGFIEQLTDLETLHLYGVPATDVTLKMLQGHQKLRMVGLRDLGKLTAAGFRSIASLPSLHNLAVRGPLTTEGLTAIATNRKLEILALNDDAFTEQDFAAIASIPSLRTLTISTRGPVPAAAWARLALAKKLVTLTVENTPKSAEMIAQIGKLASLTTLSLGDVTLPDADLSPLGSLPKLHTLRTSAGSTIEGTFCSAWVTRPAMKTLTLNSTRSVSDKVLRIFTTIFPKLDRLDVRANAGSVTPAGLAYLPGLDGLDHLTLTGDAVDDAGLAHLTRCARLRHLGVGSARITDASVQSMAKLTALRELEWSNPPITDLALKSYAKLRGLTRFQLGPGTKPEVEGTLKAALLGVTIAR